MTTTSGSRPQAPVAPPGPAQIVWVSSMIEEGARSPGDVANGLVVAGLGEHDPDVGQGRFEQDGRDVAVGERRLEPVDVVELDDAGRLRDVDLRPDRAADRDDAAVRSEHRDGLVDRAVVAVVVDDDLRATGDRAAPGAGPTDSRPRRQRELPRADPEPAGQLLADPGARPRSGACG